MYKRVLFWIAAVLFVTSLALLFLSFTPSIAFLFIISVSFGFLLAWLLIKKPDVQGFDLQNSSLTENDSSEEGFALAHLFEATMSGMREGLLVVDRDLRVVASNAAARSLFRPSMGRLESQSLTQLTRNPEVNGAFLDALNGTERSGVKVETFGEGRSIFDLRVVPLSGDRGAIEGAIGVFFDITRLERLERVRQEFLSNVSHELRTPLTAILAFVETLETSALEDEEDTRRFLEIIRRNAARMHNLIADILELSAIEAGTVKVELAPVQLMPVVNEVNASLAALADTRGIQLNNEVSSDAYILADRARLEQMLTNLIENAIKFNRTSGTVSVRFEQTDRSRILVEDTGEGIPAQHLERLFERFYRVDRARSREMGGTGLGLAIVKHLALAQGGEVNVESKLGEGSTFIIELPKFEGSLPGRKHEKAVAQTAIH